VKSLKCLEADYRRTDPDFGHQIDGSWPVADEDPALQGISGQDDTNETDSGDVPPGGGEAQPISAVALAAGAKSAPREPTDEEVDLWNRIVANESSFDNIELASLGQPVSVVTQVVSGMIYDFRFDDGTVVSVIEQDWTDTLDIQSITPPALAKATTTIVRGDVPFSVAADGGWSSPAKPNDDDLAVWSHTVRELNSYEGVDLLLLGEPILVQSQVVSGMNYRFIFIDGTVVTVFSQPWTNTLEVKNIEQPTSQEGIDTTTV